MKKMLEYWDAGRALKVKMFDVGMKDKLKLTVKCCLRVIGIKKPLFLGGYRSMEDARQKNEDEEVLCRLGMASKIETENKSCYDEKEKISITSLLHSAKESYIAFCVETLDKGGLEEVVRLLAISFQKKRIPIKVLCLQGEGQIAEDLKKREIEVICFWGKLERLRELCETKPPLLVNTHYVCKGIEVFKENEIPVIEVIHNTYVYLHKNDIVRERQRCMFVDHYIAVSDEAKRIFLKKIPEVGENQLTVIENAYSTIKESLICREKTRKTLGISENALVFIVVGSICARKNQLGILRAWSIFTRLWEKESLLVFVGEVTEPTYMKKIRWLCADRNLEESVMFLGHRDDTGELLEASDICILDSYYEGASMAALEALCVGTPLIHSDCGNGKSLIAEEKNGLLVLNPLCEIELYGAIRLRDAMNAGINQNIEQLVQAMLTMAERQGEWREKREDIRGFARATWSKEKMINKYIEVFVRYIDKGRMER